MSRMRRLSALAALLVYIALAPSPIAGVSNSVVISQVYGGGGNAGATFKNDFIELYNRGAVAVSLNGWSVQYAATAGTSWQRTNLTNVMLQPGQYYLIQEAQGAGGTTNLPVPDATGTIPMAAGAGKVVLVNNQTLIASGTSCPSGASVIDLVGFGTGTNCFEGTGPTPSPSNTNAVFRINDGATDTDANNADFVVGVPNPRNANPSKAPSITSTAANPTIAAQGAAVTFTLTAKPGENPASVSLAAAANLTPIGGPALAPFTASGFNGSGEQVFTLTTTVAAGTTPGPKSISVTLSDNFNRQSSSTISMAVRSATTTSIHDIQGSASFSVLADTAVTTEGIVTAVKSNGFYIQNAESEYDADANTSEGIFVFTSSAPPAAAALGNRVLVIGKVQEFVPSSDPFSPPTTELGNAFVAVQSTGNPLPAPTALTAANFDPNGSIEQLEPFEGMRVSIDRIDVIAPTEGFQNEAAGTSTSDGSFYGVLPGVHRPFREPGLETPEPPPSDAPFPGTIPRFDANPEKIRIDTDALTGSTAIDVTPGQTVTGLVGPLDYVFRSYTILTEPASPPAVSGLPLTPTPARAPLPGEFTVATANLERFFDTVDDPVKSDVKLTQTAFDMRLNKVSLQIRDIMHSPDIIGVEEVENLETLQAIAAKVNADASAAGETPNYAAFLVEGNDIGGIDSGFLVKSSRATVLDVTQEGLTTTFTQPDGTQALLNDRPPLVLRATVRAPDGSAFPVTVIDNHMRSLSGINGSDGQRIRSKRRAQAEFLANFIQARQSADPGERIISIGDYNAFQFNDGYVDSIGTIKGTPTPPENVTLASQDLVDPDLVELAPDDPAQHYSFLFDGTAQELDHILITQNLAGLSNGLSYGRNNADFPESARNNRNTPTRLSDHDPVVAYFAFASSTTTSLSATPPTSTFSEMVTFTATVAAGNSPVTQGDVTFTEGGTSLTQPIALDGNGHANFATDVLTAGAHTITATYNGTARFLPSAGDVTTVVNSLPTATTLLASSNPVTFGSPVTFTAAVTDLAPGGERPTTGGGVTFYDDQQQIGSVLLDNTGHATLTTSTLTAGAHDIRAVFAGDTNRLSSSATISEAVQPTISINDVTVTEGNSGTTTATFMASLSAPSSQTVSVNFSTGGGTATSGVDYVDTTGVLTFAPGVVSQPLQVIVNADVFYEPDEIFSVNLSAPTNATLGDAQGIGTIANDDPVPSIAINDVTVTEPASGISSAIFTVALSNPSQQTVLVNFATANGTAAAGIDYVTNGGTLMFAPGTTTQTISVTINANPANELVETFVVNLSAATNATIGDSQGTGAIVDAKAKPLTIKNVAPSAGAPGATVTIVGSAFSAVTSVKFNGVSATFTVVSPSVIKATVPTLATTGHVSVTTPVGTATSTDIFTVLKGN